MTSLDVIHSFWAYQLGVKADANPGVDNIVYVRRRRRELQRPLRRAVRHLPRLHVRHRPGGDAGRVHGLDPPGSRSSSSPSTKCLPPYATIYFPDTERGEADDRHRSPRSRYGRQPLWRRLIGFNLLTAVILGVGGYYLGWFIGHQIHAASSFEYSSAKPTKTTSRCCSATSSA